MYFKNDKMFRVGDRLQFIDEEDTKVIVCYNDAESCLDENFVYYKYTVFKGKVLGKQKDKLYIAHIKLLEWDYDYYRKMKLKKIIKCLK